MSEPSEWQDYNARHLASALDDLRQRLDRYIQEQHPKPPAPAPEPPAAVPTLPAPPHAKPVPRSFLERMLRKQAAAAVPPPAEEAPPVEAAALPAAPPPAEAPADESRAIISAPSALEILSGRLGLTKFAANVLLLCAAMELDTRIAGLCARAHDDPAKPFPTFALALTIFDDPSWDVLSPEHPLRYWRLIDILQSGTQPLTASALRADERIVNYLKGLNVLDDRVASFLVPSDLEITTADLAPSQGEVVEDILRRWQQETEIGPLPVMQLHGTDPISKQLVAYHAAAQLNRRLYRLPLELLPTASADLETLARLWQRESRLLPLALYLDAEEAERDGAERHGALSRFLSRSDGLFFLGVREVLSRVGHAYVVLDVAKPTSAEQHAAWAEAFGAEAPDSPAQLAAQFDLNLPNLRQLARLAHAETAADPGASLADKAWSVCCASERPRLDALAQRLELKVQWDDLVLPRAETQLLHQIADQVAQRNKVYQDWGFARKMNRGFGISALFEGDSGCGKTMAAEVIANELKLNLYRIDLSAVVNKYIGETEKNLRRLFDAAATGGAILFFDEADALFGKRFEAKDSHDHYANIQVNYLLQSIESYRGLAILATNRKSALDTAFLRRLRFVVNFSFPVVADRKRLWEKVFLQHDAAAALPVPPLDRLDYNRLARLNLAPGSIQNVVLNACFAAAHAGTSVTMAMVLDAARTESLKLGQPINEAEFRWVEPALPAAQPPPVIEAEPIPA